MSSTESDIFDAQFATNQFSGNHSLLIQILGKFISQHHDFDSLLAKQIQENDISAAKQHVHTLKGVAGNLGMVALHKACSHFEKSINEGITEEQIQYISNVFQQTREVIEKYSEKDQPSQAFAQPEQDDERATLLKALKHNEFISDSKLKHYTQAISMSPVVKLQLEQAVKELDYSKAIRLLS
ncbi:Hpt domain-containing protein [Paraglaciecola aestuariivivens]